MIKTIKILLFLIPSLQVISQSKKLDTVFCDCNQSKVINVFSKSVYGKTIAPQGAGVTKEISQLKQKTKFAFEREHNSSWHKLAIKTSGLLTMNIMPAKADDDYDFMIFKADNNNFCDSLQKHKIIPVRACISRVNKDLKGKTGLSFNSKLELVKYGEGAAFCKPLEVKKGDVYYLVLDNVYEKGEGYTLEVEIHQQVLFKGIVTDENKKPINTDISITNQKGDTVAIEKTNLDGSYNFIAPISKSQSYNLNFYNDSCFTYTKNFTLIDTIKIRSITTILPRLKKGNKYSIGSINFMGGSVQYLPRAIPSMYNLYRLLQKNPNLRIMIIGHSNGRDFHDEQGIIAFTKARANAIKNYLVIKGIDEKRIEIEGKGDHEMLFKIGRASENEQEQNRRVEILVVDF